MRLMAAVEELSTYLASAESLAFEGEASATGRGDAAKELLERLQLRAVQRRVDEIVTAFDDVVRDVAAPVN